MQEPRAARASDPRDLRVGRLAIPVAHWVYGTVTLLSVLVVFEGWKDVKGFGGVVLVMAAPALALTLAHLFAEVLEEHIRQGRPLAAAEWRAALLDSSHFLLILVPPLAVLLLGRLFGLELHTTIRLMLWFAVASLGFWGWLAGRRADLAGLRLVGAAAAGLAIGLVVIALQLVLKPH